MKFLKKKDILILCQYFYPEYVSSATLPTQLSEDLVLKGMTVDVLCSYPKEYYSGAKVPVKENYKNIYIRRVNYAGLNNKKRIGRIINFFTFCFGIFLRIPIMFRYKCILVYSNPPILPIFAYLVSKISHIKFIFIAYDIYPDNALILGAIKSNSYIVKLLDYINNRVYAQASNIVTISTSMKQYVTENKLNTHKEKVIFIPNWYSGALKNEYKIINSEIRKLRETWSFVVLYTGNMGEAQDMKTITDCILNFRNNEDVLFIFTGHGSKVKIIKEVISKNSIKNVAFFGFLLDQDYTDILNIADVCIVSLKKGFENLAFPSKIYGYLATGKPILAVMSGDTDITRNLIDYSAGYSIEPGNVQELNNLIIKYFKNRELVKVQGLNARKIYNDLYRREISTNKYHEIIKNIL